MLDEYTILSPVNLAAKNHPPLIADQSSAALPTSARAPPDLVGGASRRTARSRRPHHRALGAYSIFADVSIRERQLLT